MIADAGAITALRTGAIGEDDLIELATALSAAPPARSGRTVFKSVGVAMQDWAIAHLLASICLT